MTSISWIHFSDSTWKEDDHDRSEEIAALVNDIQDRASLNFQKIGFIVFSGDLKNKPRIYNYEDYRLFTIDKTENEHLNFYNNLLLKNISAHQKN